MASALCHVAENQVVPPLFFVIYELICQAGEDIFGMIILFSHVHSYMSLDLYMDMVSVLEVRCQHMLVLVHMQIMVTTLPLAYLEVLKHEVL